VTVQSGDSHSGHDTSGLDAELVSDFADDLFDEIPPPSRCRSCRRIRDYVLDMYGVARPSTMGAQPPRRVVERDQLVSTPLERRPRRLA
jgi:hypothetical protein